MTSRRRKAQKTVNSLRSCLVKRKMLRKLHLKSSKEKTAPKLEDTKKLLPGKNWPRRKFSSTKTLKGIVALFRRELCQSGPTAAKELKEVNGRMLLLKEESRGD